MNWPSRHVAGLVGLWLFLVAVTLSGRTYVPIDETRYVTVAWNMWLNGDFLVPSLNGVAYSHKPPLLFWLMNLGWAIFGVNDWWPRLVPSFFALGGGFLTMRIARLLWPRHEEIPAMSSVILFGCLLWVVFATATMFDMLVAFFTLAGMLGILIVWRGEALKGWGLVGLALGLGLLAKGPTILLQILPAALLAPWWAGKTSMAWRRWYLGLSGAILLGAALALAWAIPAGMRGGEAYQHAIFWGQTADRMVHSFAHRHPFWWYLPLLPFMFFPWLLWPRLWRGAMRLGKIVDEPGVRFCLAWLVPVFIAFSCISGKQMHYLLPIFPAFALLAARMLDLAPEHSRWDRVPLALAAMAIGLGFLYVAFHSRAYSSALWIEHIPVWSGPVFMLAALAMLLIRSRGRLMEVWKMAVFGALVVAMLFFTIIRTAGVAYDVRPVSAKLKQLEDAGVPWAHVGRYHGTFNFVGRLRRSPETVSRTSLSAWFAAHPDGRAIVYFTNDYPRNGLTPEFIQPYRGQQIGIVNRRQWQEWCMSRHAAPGFCQA